VTGKRKEVMKLAPPTALDRSQEVAAPPRSRDAGQTRQHLLEAARRRFAFDGYSATTVRDIATDVGVNVALINRYFVSKEGLFEACIASVGEQLKRPNDGESSVSQIARSMVRQLVDSSSDDQPAQLQLLLLLRSSGDPQAEKIRVNIIRSFAERIAIAGGPQHDREAYRRLLLRAEMALATTLGMVLLRSTSRLEPLSSASENELFEPLEAVIKSLLSPVTDGAR
jgi:AcrR family transcriptional regulator